MAQDLSIHCEQAVDVSRIADVVRRAYASVPYSDHREYVMVERLRETTAYIPALSLLAEVAGEAVGHILLTRATIGSGHAATPTLSLAPLSVVPEFQGRGIGRQLVFAAHRQAAELGFASIVLVGIASYYPRFGYERLSRYPITLPFAAPESECMILSLAPHSLQGVSGQVHYADGWLDHD